MVAAGEGETRMLKKKAKQILSGILSAAIFITGLPISALAAPAGVSQEWVTAEEVGQDLLSSQEKQEDLKLEKEGSSDFAVYGSAGKTDTAFTIGEKVSIDLSGMPENVTASAISFIWYAGGEQRKVSKNPLENLNQAIDFSVYEKNADWEYQIQYKDCNQDNYAAIELYDGEAVKETYKSNQVHPIVPLIGTPAAGKKLTFGLEQNLYSSISVQWFEMDGEEEKALTEEIAGTLSNAAYYLKDASVGKKVFAKYTLAGENKVYQTALCETVAASEVVESIQITESELSVGKTLNYRNITGILEGFTKEEYSSSFWGDRSLENVRFSVMASDDASLETPADDKELVYEEKQRSSSIPVPSYTLQQADQGKYIYLKLAGSDLRKPVYTSQLSGPVTEKKIPVSTTGNRVSRSFYTDEIPYECYSQGAYSCRILRTTGEAGAEPVEIKSSVNTGERSKTYYFTEADIDSYVYMEFTAADGIKYTTERTGKILPRNLRLYDSLAQAGMEIKLRTSDADILETVKADYKYYLTETEEIIETTQKAEVLSGSVTANKSGNLSSIIPAYRIKDADAGKYLHLDLTIQDFTYTLDLPGKITEREVSISCGRAAEGNDIWVNSDGNILPAPGSRYQWLRKSVPDAEGAKDASVGAGTEETAAEGRYDEGGIPSYKIGPEDAGKYLYLKIVSGDGNTAYYSKSSIGPVEACPLLTGQVLISGKAVSGEKLSANLDGKTAIEGVSFEWYHAGINNALYNPSENSWEYTLTEQDAGHQVYAKAVGDGTLFRGSVSSARTDVVLSQLSAEVTGILAVKAELKNQGKTGFITEQGEKFGNRENLAFDATVYGVTSLPENFAIGIEVCGILYVAENPKGTAGTDSITFQNLVVSNPDLWPGDNQVYISVGKILQEEGSEKGSYEPVDIAPAFLNAEAEELMELRLLNVLNQDGQLEVAEGGLASLLVSAEEEGVTFSYQLEEEVQGISVDPATGVVSAEKGAPEAEASVIVIAVKGNRLGMLKAEIKTVSEAAAPEKIELSLDSSTNHDSIISELERLSTGYETDPNKSNEALHNQLQLDYVVTPENALKNYVVEWTSSNPEAAAVNSDGLVTALKPGAQVTITAAIKGTQIQDSVTFTTATPKYDPKEIYFQAKKVTLKEQTYQPLTNLKVKYLVNGKTNRTLKAANSHFEFSSNNEAVVRVDERGMLFAVAPGEAMITAKLLGTAIQKEIPVVVKDKEYVFVTFVLNGHYVSAFRDAKGVLQADVLLYEGTDVPAKLEFSLDQATAGIISENGEVLSREAVLTDKTLKINKKYKTNVPAAYTLKLKNDQKLKLTVTIADTQPKHIRSGVLYNSLDAETPVSFQVYPGTKIRSASVPSGGAVSVTSWSQNSEIVTVWVKCEENIKPTKKLNTVFEFDTADLVTKESVKKSVTVPLRVEVIPKAAFSPVYITAEAFSNKGYLLKNNNDDYAKYVEWFEELPEFTDTVENYKTGFYTVCTKIEDKKGGKLGKNLLTVSDGRIMLADGVRPEEIKPGSYPYEVTYYYQAANSDAKTEEETAVVTINFSNFEFDQKQLGIHMAYEAKDEDLKPVQQEFLLNMYSHKDARFGISKADLKKNCLDERYGFTSNMLYELYHKATGKEVEGVLLRKIGNYTDEMGQYSKMSLTVKSTSELLKDGAKVYPAGTFELRMYAENTKSRPVVILNMPEIAVNKDSVVIKPGKPKAFNQTAFKAQRSELSYSVSKKDFAVNDISVVMTKAPQMEDPFDIYINRNAEKLVIQADSKVKKTPAAGTYSYTCVADNGKGISSEEFNLNVVVKKAVGDIVVKAKATGKLNPYYHNRKTGEGCVEITFSSNIPALDIWYSSGAIMETPKKAKNTVAEQDVKGKKIGVVSDGTKLLFYPKENSYFDSSSDYVPTDIRLEIGYFLGDTNYFIELYSAFFKQLKPLAVKEALKYNSFYGSWFSVFEKEHSIDLISENNILIADPIDPVEQLNGEALYREIDGEFILANPGTVAIVETLTLDPKSKKNFEIKDYGSNGAIICIVNEEIRKEGTQKVTYQMIPSSAASYEKQQVYDTSGNPLYIMTENFDGKETYTLCTIDVPKRVKMTQDLYLAYWGSLNPAEK